MGALKRVLLGRPLASEEAGHQLLPKLLALPIFASDALSSNAYATQEILHVLEQAGRSALGYAIPIAAAVVVLLIIVITSYRQTVRAYPRGGGSYIVSKDNIGETPGLIAGAALLIDYVLTVAVSIAAAAFAIASLAPNSFAADHRVGMALIFIAFITLLNLRGAKESGKIFAIPTYGFVVSIVTMIVVGAARCTFGSCPDAETAHHALKVVEPLSILLILRAFSSGATALTGVEAIADGVSAFKGRTPAEQAKNAATTLSMLAVISLTMFVGITILAYRMHAVPLEDRSVVAQIAHATFGGGFGFAIVQVMTALILILAANTAYQDFPRLSSILAKDRFMPRQFINRGDRLVFSNGVIVLAVFAALLIVIYDADVSRLIQLYVVGVFTSFTLSQAGMVMRWRRLREPASWRRNAIINGIGATTTGVVLIVVAVSKFIHGAWIVIVAIPLLVLLMKTINKHYRSVAEQLRMPQDRPARGVGTRAVVLVARVDEATMRALGYARALRPVEVRAVHVGTGEEATLVANAWRERRLPVQLDIVPGDPQSIIEPIRKYIRAMPQAEDEFITVVLPELFRRFGWRQFISRRRTLLLKTALLFERQVVLSDVPTLASENWASHRGSIMPGRTTAIVLVSAVHNATLRALEYARSLSPTELRAVTFNVDPDETKRVLSDWSRMVDDIALEAIDSPYREVTRPLIRYARQLRAMYPDTVVSVILPEFVVRKWWHQFLHNQSALSIKAGLLFEPGVVVTSVPFHLQ
ncbi:MAG TPA: APC family permease [Actinomycetota bacterium]|nr:APC family permease [Actinomycetota bacterium]